MRLEFTKNEIVQTLTSLGYEIVTKDSSQEKSRRKIWNKSVEQFVKINDKLESIDKIFKQEIIKSLLKNNLINGNKS